MKQLDRLEFISGAVVDVQIIERQVVAASGARQGKDPPATGAIIGRQRIFIDGPGAADPHYDFDRCELAVRKDQEIAFARLPVKGGKPVNVMLVNRTMATDWSFSDGLARLTPGPGLGAVGKGLIAALLAGVLAWLIFAFVAMRDAGQTQAILLACVVAAAVFLVAWVVFAALSIGAKQRAARAISDAIRARLLQASPAP